MTSIANRSRAASAPFVASRALAALVLLLPLALAGCGVPAVGRLGGLLGGGSKAPSASPEEALAEAQLLTTMQPTEAYWPYRAGELLLAKGAAIEAEEALKTSLARDPSHAPALSLLSKIYFDAKRHEEAVVMLEAVRSNARVFPGGMPRTLLEGLALHYDALGRPDVAAAVLDDIARSGAANAASPLVYLRLRGDTPDAANDPARTALDRNPRSAANYNNYGITLLRTGDPKAARKAFLTAIDIDPDMPGPYYNLAILEKYYLFHDDSAARWFRMYRDRANDDPDGLAQVLVKPAPDRVAEKKD
jgi:tetratricopeptide (TPR) repeat protein